MLKSHQTVNIKVGTSHRPPLQSLLSRNFNPGFWVKTIKNNNSNLGLGKAIHILNSRKILKIKMLSSALKIFKM